MLINRILELAINQILERFVRVFGGFPSFSRFFLMILFICFFTPKIARFFCFYFPSFSRFFWMILLIGFLTPKMAGFGGFKGFCVVGGLFCFRGWGKEMGFASRLTCFALLALDN